MSYRSTTSDGGDETVVTLQNVVVVEAGNSTAKRTILVTTSAVCVQHTLQDDVAVRTISLERIEAIHVSLRKSSSTDQPLDTCECGIHITISDEPSCTFRVSSEDVHRFVSAVASQSSFRGVVSEEEEQAGGSSGDGDSPPPVARGRAEMEAGDDSDVQQRRLPSTASTQEGRRSPTSEPMARPLPPPPPEPSASPHRGDVSVLSEEGNSTCNSSPLWVEPLVRGTAMEADAAGAARGPQAPTAHVPNGDTDPTPTRRIFGEASSMIAYKELDEHERDTTALEQRQTQPAAGGDNRVSAASLLPSKALLHIPVATTAEPAGRARREDVAGQSYKANSPYRVQSTVWVPPTLPPYWNTFCNTSQLPSSSPATAAGGPVAGNSPQQPTSSSFVQQPSVQQFIAEERTVAELRRSLHTQEGLVQELLLAREQVRLALDAQHAAEREAVTYRNAFHDLQQEMVDLENNLRAQHRLELVTAQEAFDTYDRRFTEYVERLQAEHEEDERRWYMERKQLMQQLSRPSMEVVSRSPRGLRPQPSTPAELPHVVADDVYTRETLQRKVDRYTAARRNNNSRSGLGQAWK